MIIDFFTCGQIQPQTGSASNPAAWRHSSFPEIGAALPRAASVRAGNVTEVCWVFSLQIGGELLLYLGSALMDPPGSAWNPRTEWLQFGGVQFVSS